MNLEGVFPPMATPFVRGDVDVAGVRSNVEKWIRAGVRGIVALGTNGEALLLTEDESDSVIAAAREAVPSSHVLIAGTGRESTAGTVDASRRAAAIGADAVLVRTPAYFKARMTHEAFVRHYTAVADACPVPVLLYNFTAMTGVNLSPETVAQLAQHPNIIGVKESGTDGAQMAAIVDLSPPPPAFTVIAGSAPTFFASLCLGARGAILGVAGVVPEICVSLYEHARAGRREEARHLQAQLTPLAQLITTVFGVPGLKAAMDLAGFVGGDPRPPLIPAPSSAVEQIRAELDRISRRVHGVERSDAAPASRT
jgi:4-hydroxy-2-oxoglutarate aldolase